MDKQIFLVDLVNDFEGHFFMMEALSKIENSYMIDTKERKMLIKNQPIKGLLERRKIHKRVFREIREKQKGNSVVHFLTGDKFYFLPIIKSLNKNNLKVLVNIHRFPKNAMLQKLLKNYSKKIDSFVVFSDYTADEFRSIGINNVKVLAYPTFYDYSIIPSKKVIKEKYNIDEKYTVISALGGTRYEKGLDILLESFKYISPEIKARILVNIAGREQDIKKDQILELAKKYDINLRLELRNLSDEEFCENVVVSDIMAMPYRKTFNSSASGPMTEAMSQGVPCLYPRYGSLEKYGEKYKVGSMFEIEDPQSIAKEIEKMISGEFEFDESIAKNLSVDAFIESHKKLYRNI